MAMSTNSWIEKHGAEALNLYATTSLKAAEIAARYEGATKNRLCALASRHGYKRGGGSASRKPITAFKNRVSLRHIHTDAAAVVAQRGDLKRMLTTAANLSRIGINDLIGPSQMNSIAYRRWRVCYLLRQAGLSYPRIGMLLKKHHTTCMKAVHYVEAELALSSTPINEEAA